MSELLLPETRAAINHLRFNLTEPGLEIIDGVPSVRAGKLFAIAGLKERLEEKENTFFFDNDFAHKVGLNGNKIESARFEPMPDWFIGREASLNGVYFGWLDIKTDTGEEIPLPLAVKPYDRGYGIAGHELAAFQHVRRQGFIDTFEPVGLWTSQGGRVSVLTVFEPEVMSLDNCDWNKMGREDIFEHAKNLVALEKSAQILGLLHGHGYAHKDAQIKNMAVITRNHTDEGAVHNFTGLKLIDLTTLQLTFSPELPDTKRWAFGVYEDLFKLVKSLIERSYLEAGTAEERMLFIESFVLRPHASLLRHPSAPILHQIDGCAEIVDKVHQKIKEQFLYATLANVKEIKLDFETDFVSE